MTSDTSPLGLLNATDDRSMTTSSSSPRSATNVSFPGRIQIRLRALDTFEEQADSSALTEILHGDIFAALADPTRRAVLKLLRRRDLSAGEIAEHFPLAKSTLSGHFAVLKQAGLIVAERHGTTIVYSANVSTIEEGLSLVLELLGSRSEKTSARARTLRQQKQRS